MFIRVAHNALQGVVGGKTLEYKTNMSIITAASKGKSVAVSLEVLESLASYPLPLAARRLCIGKCDRKSSMKKSCSQLGISRWPYLPEHTVRNIEAQVAQVEVIPYVTS